VPSPLPSTTTNTGRHWARAAGDLEASLWTWLGHTDRRQRDALYLYTGRDDRFHRGHRLLAALLPADHVVEVPGGHDWPVWMALWQCWLAQAPWPRA
jgi:hypothetical protein